MNKFDDIDYWKGIVLYGLNQATYKIALGKTIIELASSGEESVDWNLLSKTYLDNYLNRLKENSHPQQNNPSRKTKMERIIDSLNKGIIDYQTAVSQVETEAFNDVIPRFQTIGTNKEIVGERFYHFDFGKKLYLHDPTFKIIEDSKTELLEELDARWSVLEGHFLTVHDDWELSNSIRDIYLVNGHARKNITHNIPFLQGYQGNICFYCGEPIERKDIHVDHVLPRQFIQHDEIWNLVLSHDICNLHKNDSLVGKHYFEKLIARNENIMGSNHPWKRKILNALGNSKTKRGMTMWKHYENAKIVLKNNFWENSPSYNRETDPFFKKLITVLNNR
ncbi:HNH endonuclease [Aestuariivivens sediminicola]|uniref:HNH endonuclease n=1 Tax=Aestuariivivens sediminicola TaxID=2913560 RepID=UPI001F56C244|nr:HNH endonuclease domain-containing protein [Aestuariivivens sediminicola]